MKLAGSTLTFSRRPLPEALGALARLGFTEMELAALEGWAHVSPARLAGDPQVADEVVRTVEGAGLRTVAINSGLGTSDPQQQCGRLTALARLAERLGATVVTVPAGRVLDEAEILRLRRLVEVVGPGPVALAVECHMGALTEDPAAAVAACRAVPGLRLTLDPSHYWAGPAQGRAWEVVAPFVAHVHVRDAGTGGWQQIQVAPGMGQVDFPAVVRCLCGVGYSGAYAEEYIDTLPVAGGLTAEEAAARAAEWARPWGE